jgi:hypothetical protein
LCKNANFSPNVAAKILLKSKHWFQIIVNSEDKAAIWQNKRTGLFEFMGEHNGKPVYQNDATKEFLFFTFTGSEWLVGPDFRKPHAGIQVTYRPATRKAFFFSCRGNILVV